MGYQEGKGIMEKISFLINSLFVAIMIAYSLLLGCLWVAFVAVTVPICLVIGAVSSVVEWVWKKLK
jgi:hypothetical protein